MRSNCGYSSALGGTHGGIQMTKRAAAGYDLSRPKGEDILAMKPKVGIVITPKRELRATLILGHSGDRGPRRNCAGSWKPR